VDNWKKISQLKFSAKGGLEKLKRKGILRKNGGIPGQKYKSII